MNLNLKKSNDGTVVRVGEVRFSYARVFEPYAPPDSNQKPKYSVCVLIPKTNTEAVSLINNGIAAAAKNGADKYWSGKIPANLKKPLRDGDEEHPDDPEYAGMWFLNARNERKPGVQVFEDGLRYDTEDPDEFYSGCWGGVVLTLYSYNAPGNKGVGVSLGNLIKTRDDTRLSGSRESSDDSWGDLE